MWRSKAAEIYECHRPGEHGARRNSSGRTPRAYAPVGKHQTLEVLTVRLPSTVHCVERYPA